MLAFLEREANYRKLRLLAAAFCRHIEHLIITERLSRLLAEVKRFGVFYGNYRPGSLACLLKPIEDV